jgi:hypothetical protein
MWNWPASIAAAVLCGLQYRRMAKTEADLQRAEVSGTSGGNGGGCGGSAVIN